MSLARRTLAAPTLKLEGIGLHTGAPGWVRFLPSEEESAAGFVFRSARTGEAQAVEPESVVETRRCTVLQIGKERLSTVEHLLAALSGCGVTDCVIEYDAVEVPILDGSARGFVFALQQAGMRVLAHLSEIEPFRIPTVISVEGASGERLVAVPAESLSITVVLDYPERVEIGTQAARYIAGLTNFVAEIAQARTYGFLSEFEQMLKLGLATGASLDNCIALLDDGSADPRTPLRYTNELARHKLLDVIGDLALAGRPILADVIAVRPSHAVNCLLARRIAGREA